MPTLDKGWMPAVERVITPEGTYWPSGAFQPLAVMNHIMQGYQATMIRWAEGNPTVEKSAHFTISRGGRIVQHVSVYDMSWAAGAPCSATWALLPPDYAGSVNRLVVNIEHEGFSTPPAYAYDNVYDSSHPWPQAMVDASIAVNAWIAAEFGLEANFNTIMGHRDTDACTRALDPGAAWPQAAVVAAVAATRTDTDATTETGTSDAAPEPPDAGHAHPEITDLAGHVAALEKSVADLTQRDAEHQAWHRTA